MLSVMARLGEIRETKLPGEIFVFCRARWFAAAAAADYERK